MFKDNNKKRKNKMSLFTVGLLIVLILYAISFSLPLLWSLMTALKPVNDFDIWENKLWPSKTIDFSNFVNAYKYFYVKVIRGDQTLRYYIPIQFVYSLIYSLGCALASTIVPCMTAYVVARFKYSFGKVVYGIVIFTMALPIVGSLPSQILISQKLGLYDTLIGMLIMKGNFLGVYFLVFFAQFNTIPKDYTEAARIDGASNVRVMIFIIMPLALSSILVVFLLQFINFWNDYQTPMIFLRSYPVVAWGMYEFQNAPYNEIANVPSKLAGAMIMALPIIVIFLIFNKKLAFNLSVGGIKG